jgi:hypothetical protein
MTDPQRVIALDMMSFGIGADDIVKGPVIKREIGARVGESSKTDDRVSVEKRRMLDVMRI